MTEELVDKIKEWYNKLLLFPNKVLEIFNDYYGEENVDMQGFSTLDAVLEKARDYLSTSVAMLHGGSYDTFSYDTFWERDDINSLNEQDKARLKELLTKDVYLNKSIDTNEELALLLFPLIIGKTIEAIPDLYSGFILVHFPKVRVTNENNKYVDITHLWVKVPITREGKSSGYFALNRSEYPVSHINADYMHSHVCGINLHDSGSFLSPCLGRGPIRHTINTLALDFDENIWKLFCLELDRYVRVESLLGGPYRRLETISTGYKIDRTIINFAPQSYLDIEYDNEFTEDNMKDFIRTLIQSNKLKFNFVNDSFGLAMPFVECVVITSNLFIEWYNKSFRLGEVAATLDGLLNLGILERAKLSNIRGIDYLNLGVSHNSSGEGSYICTFKGRTITRHIIDDTEYDSPNISLLLNNYVLNRIIGTILKTLNFRYGRENRTEIRNGEEVEVRSPAIYI